MDRYDAFTYFDNKYSASYKPRCHVQDTASVTTASIGLWNVTWSQVWFELFFSNMFYAGDLVNYRCHTAIMRTMWLDVVSFALVCTIVKPVTYPGYLNNAHCILVSFFYPLDVDIHDVVPYESTSSDDVVKHDRHTTQRWISRPVDCQKSHSKWFFVVKPHLKVNTAN